MQYRIEYTYMGHKLYGETGTLEHAIEDLTVFLKAGFREITVVRVG